ncbi:MAG: lysophospholipid acyltransferase family protein [Burkholderiaceae bacterium]
MLSAFTWIGLWISHGLAKLPRALLRRLSSLIGTLTYWFYPYRRRIARRNLELCFPDRSASQRGEIALRHFRLYGLAFFDRFRLWSCSAHALRQFVRLTNPEVLEAAGERPIIILAPHFLGIEAGGMRLQLERRLVNIYSLQRNPVLDDWTLRGRQRFNQPILLARSQGVVPAVRYVKQHVPFHFSPDLDLGRRDSIFVDFFGVPASTVTSLVRIARITRAMVIPMVTRMTTAGYEARFYPGWTHPDDDAQETVHEGVVRMNRFIEERILEAPEQYLWTHRRFKTRPEGTPSVYG